MTKRATLENIVNEVVDEGAFRLKNWRCNGKDFIGLKMQGCSKQPVWKRIASRTLIGENVIQFAVAEFEKTLGRLIYYLGLVTDSGGKLVSSGLLE